MQIRHGRICHSAYKTKLLVIISQCLSDFPSFANFSGISGKSVFPLPFFSSSGFIAILKNI